MLAELDPAWAAGGKHRKSFLLGDTLDKLVGFLHDRKVGGNVHIKYLINAQTSYCSYHFALNVCANWHSEAFAKSSTDRRSGKEYDLLIGI